LPHVLEADERVEYLSMGAGNTNAVRIKDRVSQKQA
jgi:hypothetical protein